MLNPITIAFDVMGGDLGPRLAVMAAQKFALASPETRLLLIGNPTQIDELLTAKLPNVEVIPAGSVVTMEDRPASVFRKKPDSSMAIAIESIASNQANACVSSGNTGALMAFGLWKLGTLSRIDRPAICRAVPSAQGKSYLLDLGANIECSAHQLAQFALLGSAMAKASGILNPRVGVLNVGVEDHKGGTLQRETLSLLRQSELNLVGFVEGDGIYKGVADVIVCDGFTGNAVLKASEGAAGLIRRALGEVVADFDSVSKARIESLLMRFDPEQFNGATLLGLDGIVIKSHGATTEIGFLAALQMATELVRCDFLTFLRGELTQP